MTLIRPVTIASEITKRADEIYAQHATFVDKSNNLPYKMLIRDCQRLKEADALEGWIAHGLCELLTGDESAFRKCFQNARNLAGSRSDECDFMFSQGLLRAGRHAEALQILRIVSEPERGAFSERSGVIERACAFNLLTDLHTKAKEMKISVRGNADFDLAAQISAILGQDDLSDDVVAQYLDCASQPILQRRLLRKGHAVDLLNFDGREVVLITLLVDADGETLANMTFDFAETLVEMPAVPPSLHISYGAATDAS